ncbi:MAG: hypothetical protein ACR2NN_16075 [Bryobacteraceae bacterium]
MNTFRKIPNTWRRAASVVAFTSAWVTLAHAQTPPYSLFQYSTLTASANIITATRVPIVNAAGATTYVNITVQFEVDSDGNLTISSGYPQVVAAPVLLVSTFKAGKYVGPGTIYKGDFVIAVSGPGVTVGGATEWSLAAPTGGDVNTYPGSATWYVGPVESSPLAARLKKAGITSTAWSYGIGGSQWGLPWAANTLIGVSQIGNTLTVVSFTNGNGDQSEPVDQITYTLAP